VYWSTTDPPKEPPKPFKPASGETYYDELVWHLLVEHGARDFEAMSRETYEELLWHLLLRGCDTFAMWSPAPETAVEVQPVHKVYADSLQYAEFLDNGKPVLFDVPNQPGTVISALQLGGKLLVRRTDFAGDDKPVDVMVDGKKVSVPAAVGKCLILEQ